MGDWDETEFREYRDHYAEKRQRELLLLVDLLSNPTSLGTHIEELQALLREIIRDLRHD